MTSKPSLRDALPPHWQLKRLKFIARIQTGVAKGKDYGDDETVEVPYLRVANVQDGYLALDDVATMTIPVSDLDRYRLQPGDVLMNEGGDFDKLGRGHVWHGQIDPCIHQNHVFAFRPHGVSPEWLNAWTGSAPAQFYFMARAKQSTNLASISSSNLMELPVPVPPISEQIARLTLIYAETARIDALIEKKTRFIELLREKRQAEVTQATTKGLDPTVQLQDSCVEWLGFVPQHWIVSRLKYTVRRFEQGWSPDCFTYPAAEDEWGVLKSGCVNGGEFNGGQNKSLPPEQEPRPDIEVRDGDVLMSRASGSPDLIGSVAQLHNPRPRLMLSDKIFRVYVEPNMNSEFFVLLMGSTPMREQIKQAISGAEGLANNLAQSSIKDFFVARPPVDEQEEIAQKITGISRRIDGLISRTEGSLTLLLERRSALITAAVTGQIDIPEGS